MKLAEPVKNAGGVTLMPAGIRLTPMVIARIKKWNIDALEVFVDKAPAPEENAAESARTQTRSPAGGGTTVSGAQEQFARAVAGEVAKVFANVRENPLMMQLRSIVIRRIVAKGPRSAVALLRRGPSDELPLPVGEGD